MFPEAVAYVTFESRFAIETFGHCGTILVNQSGFLTWPYWTESFVVFTMSFGIIGVDL